MIALIITVIILVILAAVSIRAVYNMGIVGHAINGTQQYAERAAEENRMFGDLESFINNAVLKIKGIQEGTGLTLNKTALGLQLVGNTTVTEKLTATLLNITGDVNWTSSVPEVATVSSDGTVTAVSLGNTVVTAKVTYDGKEYSASCEVNITNIPVTNVSLNETSKTLELGETLTLTATVTPDTATNSGVTWSSDTPAVATVSNGVVTAVGAGSAIITATANDGSGYSANCVVTVVIHPTSMTISATGNKTEIEVDEELQLSVSTVPEVITDTITWSSSDTSRATVNNTGLVTGVAEGTITITATAKDSNNNVQKTATYDLSVSAPNTNPLATSVLEEGDYVIYNNITCRVLYGSSSDYGIELISNEAIGSVYLGKEDTNSNVTANSFNTSGIKYTGTITDNAKKSAASYNRAVITLNEKAQSYVVENDGIVDKSKTRCVGSNPGSENVEINYSVTKTATNNYIYTYGYNNKFKAADTNEYYLRDCNKMTELGILNVESSYWLASRLIESDASSTSFHIRYVNESGTITRMGCTTKVSKNGSLSEGNSSIPIRPVFHLQTGVQVVVNSTHDGSSEENAYELQSAE